MFFGGFLTFDKLSQYCFSGISFSNLTLHQIHRPEFFSLVVVAVVVVVLNKDFQIPPKHTESESVMEASCRIYIFKS